MAKEKSLIKEKVLIKEIVLKGKALKYKLEYKRVKNINLRIKSDMTVNISAPKAVSVKSIEEFMIKKADFIISALEKYSALQKEKTPCFTETELKNMILDMCREVYPYFKDVLDDFPKISFRKMKTCWGSCRPVKSSITFNTNLIYAPKECVKYIVCHEFTHFIQPNHSRLFYSELEKIFPDWRASRAILKTISCV